MNRENSVVYWFFFLQFPQLPIYLPEQADYEAFNLQDKLAKTTDDARTSQFLQADVKTPTPPRHTFF